MKVLERKQGIRFPLWKPLLRLLLADKFDTACAPYFFSESRSILRVAGTIIITTSVWSSWTILTSTDSISVLSSAYSQPCIFSEQ